MKMLQGQLERVRKELGALEEKFNEAIGNKALLEIVRIYSRNRAMIVLWLWLK